MAKISKIEDRTLKFIEAYNRLKESKEFPPNTELAKILHMSSKSTVSEILGKRQNIQPKQWEYFKSHFGIKDEISSSENSVSREKDTHSRIKQLEEEIDYYKNQVLVNLDSVHKNVVMTRAELRSSIEYQVMKDAADDELVRQELMGHINKLIRKNLVVKDVKGNQNAARSDGK